MVQNLAKFLHNDEAHPQKMASHSKKFFQLAKIGQIWLGDTHQNDIDAPKLELHNKFSSKTEKCIGLFGLAHLLLHRINVHEPNCQWPFWLRWWTQTKSVAEQAWNYMGECIGARGTDIAVMYVDICKTCKKAQCQDHNHGHEPRGLTHRFNNCFLDTGLGMIRVPGTPVSRCVKLKLYSMHFVFFASESNALHC